MMNGTEFMLLVMFALLLILVWTITHGLNKRIDDLDWRFQHLDKRIDDLRESLNWRFKHLDKRMDDQGVHDMKVGLKHALPPSSPQTGG
jgi:hypothetical protein